VLLALGVAIRRMTLSQSVRKEKGDSLMRIADYVITAAVVAGLSGTAMAQTPTSTQTPTNQPTQTPVVAPTYSTPYENHWLASAFVGTNFGSGRSDTLLDVFGDDSGASINFGGEAAYLWGGFAGVEGLVDFAPSFTMDNLLFQDSPTVNTYMINGITTVPLGEDNQFLPYVSGGIGAVQLRSTIFTLATAVNPAIESATADGSRFGGNFGGGVMGFSGRWGFRGDIRYYKTSVDDNVNVIDTPENIFAQQVLSGLAFWKANVGVAFRW
jgi:hypothetical protein